MDTADAEHAEVPDVLEWLQDSTAADRVRGKMRLTVISPDWFDKAIHEIVRLRDEVERLQAAGFTEGRRSR